MPKTLKFTKYQQEARIEPLRLELPDGDVVVVPVPDGDKMCLIEEAGQTRKALRQIFGDDFDRVNPLLKSIKDPAQVREFMLDILRHFGMGDDAVPPADGERSSN